MNIFMIGGSGFIGQPIASELRKSGHTVTVFHRGHASVPPETEQILGDRNRLRDFRDLFAQRHFDVVIDMILSSEDQARETMDIFRGLAGRIVVLSSMDVYRAWGVFYGHESGGLQEMPVTEDSELRTRRGITYPPDRLEKLREIFPWFNDKYEKITVEETVLKDPSLPGTVLRLPMVYGPGDPIHRLYYLLKRMEDGRKTILFAEDVARLRTPKGYVENVAHAIALAATSPRASGRVYNVAEPIALSELEWARKVAAIAGWDGNFVVLPHDRTPQHLWSPGNTAQHLAASSNRIRTELGYCEVIPVEEAIRRTIHWEREHPPDIPLVEFDYPAEDAALAQLQAAS